MELREFFKALRGYPPIREELHAAEFEDGFVKTKDGRLFKVLKVKPPEDPGLTQKELDRISELLSSVLSFCDTGIKVDLTVVKDRKIEDRIGEYLEQTKDRPERFRKLCEGTAEVLKRGVEGEPFKGIFPRRLTYYLTVSLLPEKSSVPSAVRELLPFFGEGTGKEVVDSNAKKIAEGLKAAGLSVEEAGEEEVRELFYFVLNPRKAYKVSPPPAERIPDSVCQSYVEVVNDTVNRISYLKVDETPVYPIRTEEMSPFTFGQMGKRIVDLWKGDCVLNFSFYLSRSVLPKKFELITKRVIKNAYRMNPEDVEAEERFNELREFEKRLHGGDRPIFFEMNGVLIGGTTTELIGFFDSLHRLKVKEGDKEYPLFPEGSIDVDRYTPVHTLLQTLPGNLNVPEYRHRTMLSNGADYTAFLGPVEFPGSRGKPSSMFLTRQGDVATFSLFDSYLNAPLAVVTGDTGSGKSYTANYFIADMIAQGVKLWILDKQDSYVKLCKYAGGDYYRVTLETPVSFNVFDGTDVTPTSDEEKDYRAERLRLLLQFLRTVLGRDRRLTAAEEGVLTEAVSEYLRRGGSRPILGEFRKFLKDFGTTQTQREAAQKFHSILAAYTEEEGLGRFFNRPTSFNEDAQVAVLELGQVQDNPALIETLLMVFLSYVNYYSYRHRGEHKAFVGDEIWSFLTTPEVASFFVTVFRTYRKLGTAAVLISQYLTDFTGRTGNVDLSAILKSAMIFVTLNQPYGEVRELFEKGLIPFTEEDLKFFDTTNPDNADFLLKPKREFHLSLRNYGKHAKRNKSAVLLPILTPVHDWLFTTDSARVEFFNEELAVKLAEGGKSEADAVADVVFSLAELYPWGEGINP